MLLCDKSNVTGIVRRLTSAGLIERVSTADRRFTKVQLTETGQKIHDEAEKALAESIEKRFRGVPAEEHEELQRLLLEMHERLNHHLGREEQEVSNSKPVRG